jgi:hypothetical protein
MNPPPDTLYKLLPYYYRDLDVKEGGSALRDLLGVMAEQFAVVERDLDALYDDWFIETCADWAVPYIGDLAGWQAVQAAGVPAQSTEANLLRWLAPRRDVANTLRHRRRKGTLPLLEELACDVAGWPALAIEAGFREWMLARIAEVHAHRGAAIEPGPGSAPLADVHDPLLLAHIGTPRDSFPHLPEVHAGSALSLPSVALHVWRLQAFPVTYTRAKRVSKSRPDDYHFSVLGNAAPLFSPPQGAGGLPVHVLTRMEIAERVPAKERGTDATKVPPLCVADESYGPGKSFSVFVEEDGAVNLVPREQLVPSDLSEWKYEPPDGFIAVDPETGRLRFSKHESRADSDDEDAVAQPDRVVRVTWHTGFSAPMGGGEYQRPLAQMENAKIYRVAKGGSLRDGLKQWEPERAQVKHAIIEFECSGRYDDLTDIALAADESLQIRAAQGVRPVLRVLEASGGEKGPRGETDDFVVKLEQGAQFVLDGLIITGGALRIRTQARALPASPAYDPDAPAPPTPAPPPTGPDCPAIVVIRHCTLVPGWALKEDCGAAQPDKDSIILQKYRGTLVIQRSIVGSISVSAREADTDPVAITISDSILDSADCAQPAIYDEDFDAQHPGEGPWAHAALTIHRSTVFGRMRIHSMPLAEDSIFRDHVCVARRAPGCVRFCWLPPCSRTPRRYECQPEKAMREAAPDAATAGCGCEVSDCAAEEAQRRVHPHWVSTQYGQPAYAQLHLHTPEEIRLGAHDRSEMGAFHDLFQPQREANLRARLAEYTPAASTAALVFQS